MVGHDHANGMAMIRATDDGIGAPSATLATTTTGVGLVRELAGQLAADFSIASGVKSGTVVAFRFSTHRDPRQRVLADR